MTTIAVIFYSGTGTTRRVASAVSAGIADTAAQSVTVEIAGEDIVQGRWANDAVAAQLDACDALIFGSPTYMAGVSSQLKSFFDAMAPRWYTQVWNGKLAAAFTASALASGDKLNCLQDMNAFAMQMGMIWVGTGPRLTDGLNPNGFYLGAGATAGEPGELSEVDLAAASHLGRRVAELALRLSDENT